MASKWFVNRRYSGSWKSYFGWWVGVHGGPSQHMDYMARESCSCWMLYIPNRGLSKIYIINICLSEVTQDMPKNIHLNNKLFVAFIPQVVETITPRLCDDNRSVGTFCYDSNFHHFNFYRRVDSENTSSHLKPYNTKHKSIKNLLSSHRV